jgi:uracil-DNA glycosylase
MLKRVKKGWLPLLRDYEDCIEELKKKFGKDLRNSITPNVDDVFRAFTYFEPEDTKVIIIGQDPYPKDGDAEGLSFHNKNSRPRSVLNIFKCLEQNGLLTKRPAVGDLESWARQGVLLLNVMLTRSREHIGTDKKKRLHKFWTSKTRELIPKIVQLSGAKIMAWGGPAKKIVEGLDALTWCHPVAMKPNNFLDCPHFNKIIEINWNLSPGDLIVYTDGGCRGNGKPGAVASWACHWPNWFIESKYSTVPPYQFKYTNRLLKTKKPQRPTNNRGELLAIIMAIITVRQYTVDTDLTIVSDSSYCINAITKFLPNWVKNGKINTCKNSDLFKVVLELDLKGVKFIHQNGHTVGQEHSAGNNRADELCNIALDNSETKIIVHKK